MYFLAFFEIVATFLNIRFIPLSRIPLSLYRLSFVWTFWGHASLCGHRLVISDPFCDCVHARFEGSTLIVVGIHAPSFSPWTRELDAPSGQAFDPLCMFFFIPLLGWKASILLLILEYRFSIRTYLHIIYWHCVFNLWLLCSVSSWQTVVAVYNYSAST